VLNLLGKNIKIFKELDSTNNFVKSNVSNLEEGAIIVAEKQTKGRGLRDNTWESNVGNLHFSYVLKNDLGRRDLFKHIVQSSVAIIRTLKHFEIDGVIKYPNDCLVGSKKISGVLIESLGSNLIEYVVVGIGLNVNQVEFDYLKDKATSIKLNIKKDLNIVEVLNEFVLHYNSILESNYEDVFKEYINKSVVIKKKISYKGEEYFISDIEKNGTIIIRNEFEHKRVAYSEISLKELY
jgi:BirA family biotin operon repressor/biotin-[acetyl-CoA-carboxylase] ligase